MDVDHEVLSLFNKLALLCERYVRKKMDDNEDFEKIAFVVENALLKTLDDFKKVHSDVLEMQNKNRN